MIKRINRWMQKPLREKLNVFLYNYRALKLRFILKNSYSQFLEASLPWGRMKVYDDWLGQNIYLGSYEKREMIMLSKIGKRDWVSFDIGANIGYYTIFLDKVVGCERIYAFEPSPREYQLLQENLERNNCKNVVTLPFALGDRDTTIKLFLSSANKGRNSVNYFDSSDQEIVVPVKVPDDMIQQFLLTKIDFIKLDVEGAEPMVLRGSKNILDKFKPVVLYESWAFTQAPYGTFECETTRILEEHNYRIYDIDERGRLIKVEKGYMIDSGNALAIHESRTEEFLPFIRK